VALSFFLTAAVCASAQALAQAQTDIALSVYGAFSNSTNPIGSSLTQQHPAAAAGGLFEFRHLALNPLLGVGLAYSFYRANQVYKEEIYALPECPISVSCTCNNACPAQIMYSHYSVSANAHEFTADWVPTGHIAKIRPFGLLGMGLLWVQPTGSQSSTPGLFPSSSHGFVLVYGAGLDWKTTRHIGLRLQYRGNLYRGPGIVPSNAPLSTVDAGIIHTAEPALGVYYKF
jgi:opacity protein-like surface antigen